MKIVMSWLAEKKLKEKITILNCDQFKKTSLQIQISFAAKAN